MNSPMSVDQLPSFLSKNLQTEKSVSNNWLNYALIAGTAIIVCAFVYHLHIAKEPVAESINDKEVE